MKEEDLIEKLESIDLHKHKIDTQSHRQHLRRALLQSGYYKEKPGPGFFSSARLKLIASVIAHRPLWQKAVATALVAAMILGVALFIQSGQSPSVQAVIDKSRAATTGLTSFHFDQTVATEYWYEGTKVYEDTESSKLEGDYLAPDRLYMVAEKRDEVLGKYWTIGNKYYWWSSETGWWNLQEFEDVDGAYWMKKYRWDYDTGSWELRDEYEVQYQIGVEHIGEAVQPESIDERLSELNDIEELPDEVIDGVNCLHYRGVYVPSLGIEELEKQLEEESDPDMKRHIQHFIEKGKEYQMLFTEVIEIWISPDDYRVRQESSTLTINPTYDHYSSDYDLDLPVPEGATITKITTRTTRYTCFNEPVEIEAPRPVNRQGQWVS